MNLWDSKTGKSVHKVKTEKAGNSSGPVARPEFSADGTVLAVANGESRVALIDVAAGKVLRVVDSMASCLAFSPDGQRLAVGDGRRHLPLSIFGHSPAISRVFDVATGKVVTEIANANMASVTFAPDGKRLVSGTANGVVQVWNLDNGKELQELGAGKGIVRVAFSPDGTNLAAAGDDKVVRGAIPKSGNVARLARYSG